MRAAARMEPGASAVMGGMRYGLHRCCAVLSRFCEAMAAVLLAFIVVVNFLGVLYRYGLRDPIGWTEEAMRYAVVWAVFLGAVAALHRGEHMVLTLLDGAVGRRGRRLLHGLVMLLIAAFCAVVVAFGVQLALRNWNQVSPTMNLRMFWPYLAVPTGAALMLVQSLVLGLLAPDPTADHLTSAERSSAAR